MQSVTANPKETININEIPQVPCPPWGCWNPPKTWNIPKNPVFAHIENIKIGSITGSDETFAPAAKPRKIQYLSFNTKRFLLKKNKNKDKKNIWIGSGFGMVMK